MMTVPSSARLPPRRALYTHLVQVGAKKLLGVVAGVAIAGVLIGFYVSDYLVGDTTPFRPIAHSSTNGTTVNLTVETVGAIGPALSSHPDWVSYLVRDNSGVWRRTTVWTLPANA